MNKLVLKRLSQIAKIAVTEGFEYFVNELDLRAHLPFMHRIKPKKSTIKDEPQVRVRRMLENLGGGFIKLGQLLSLRPDLVPNIYCEEFRKLQDEVQPLSYLKVRQLVKKEIKQPFSKIFKEFRIRPLGSASIGQAHLARLKNGRQVVVKIQRPGIDRIFESDIDIMYFIAKKFEKKCKKYNFSPIKIVREFERYSKEELDYLVEAKHIQVFYENFQDSAKIKIPKLYTQYTTSKMLITEYLEGKKLSDLIESKERFDRIGISLAIFELSIRQIFQTNIFHADLHPGNIVVMSDNRIGLVDFGITGTLSDSVKEDGIRLILALIDQNVDQIYETVTSVGMASKDTDLVNFKKELNSLVKGWGSTFKNERVTNLLIHILNLCLEHQISIPANLIMLGKALLVVEGTCLILYPSFNFVEEAKPYVIDLIEGELKSDLSLKNLVKKSFQAKDLFEKLPIRTVEALDTIRRGSFDISVENKGMKELGKRVSILGDRVSIALIAASFIMAGALIFQINQGPFYFGYSIFTILAFGLAGVLIASLLLSFLKRS